MTTPKTAKAGPGRPRTLPEGTTASDRAALAERALKASGGHRLNVPLNASAWTALQRLAPRGKRVAYIERLILAAAKAQRPKGAGAGD